MHGKFQSLRLLLPAIVLMTALVGIIPLTARNKDKEWDERARIRLAEYTHLQSSVTWAEDRSEEFLALVDRAFDLDSTDLDIATAWGRIHIYIDQDDSVQVERAFQHMMRRFIAHPEDYEEALTLANIANQLHRYHDEVRIWMLIDSVNPDKTDPATSLAMAYMRTYIMGDSTGYDNALATIRRLEDSAGKSIDLSRMMLQTYVLAGDTVAMVDELSDLLRSAPDNPEVNLFAGSCFDNINRPDSAIKYMDRACELDSAYGTAFLTRAEFYSNHGDSVAYDREVFKALKSPNLEFESKFNILTNYVAALYEDESQHARIDDLFSVLQEMHPGEADLHTLYGYYLSAIKDRERAAEQFSLATSLDPTSEDAWIAALQAYQLNEDIENMYECAVEGMERFPDNLYFPMMAAIVLSSKDDYAGAIDVINKPDISVVHNEEAVSKLLNIRGDLYSHIDSIPQAMADYELALIYDPDNIMVYNNFAYLIAEHGGDLDKAERMSHKTIDSDPESTTYLDTYAWVLFKMQHYKDAKRYIDMAIRLGDKSGEYVALLPLPIAELLPSSESDYTYNQSESTEGSEMVTDILIVDDSEYTDYEDVEEIDEDDDSNGISEEILEHAGDIYFMNGDPDTALKLWKKALELDPEREILQRKVKHKTYFYK